MSALDIFKDSIKTAIVDDGGDGDQYVIREILEAAEIFYTDRFVKVVGPSDVDQLPSPKAPFQRETDKVVARLRAETRDELRAELNNNWQETAL